MNSSALQLTLLLPAFLIYCLDWKETAGLCVLLLLHCRYVLPAIDSPRSPVEDGKRMSGLPAHASTDIPRTQAHSELVLFSATLLVLTFVFHRYLIIVAAVWGLATLGGSLSGAAAMLGRSRWRHARLPFNSAKTWPGFGSFVVFGALGAWILMLWTASADPTARTFILCLAAAVVGAAIENLPIRLTSKITVPLVTASFIFCAGLISRTSFDENLPYLGLRVVLAVGINLVFALAALALRQVSRSGAVAGFFLGVGIYLGFGYKSFLILLAFFVLGSGCTRLGYARKQALGIAERRAGARSWREAVANLLPAAFFSLLVITTPYQSAFLAAFVAALAEAAGDTVSSEIGKWLSSRAWLITSFTPVVAGEDGGISLWGTAAGFAASTLVVGLAFALRLTPLWMAGAALAAAFIGNLADSVLGATLERRGLLTNGIVNFSGTSLAGALALVIALH
jgi:uncharacterized protein (TIGR00297 family)